MLQLIGLTLALIPMCPPSCLDCGLYLTSVFFIDQPQSSTVLISAMTTPGAPPTGEAGKSFTNGKPDKFPKYKAGVAENREILPKTKGAPVAGDIDGVAKVANEQSASIGNAIKAKVGGDIEEAKAALN